MPHNNDSHQHQLNTSSQQLPQYLQHPIVLPVNHTNLSNNHHLTASTTQIQFFNPTINMRFSIATVALAFTLFSAALAAPQGNGQNNGGNQAPVTCSADDNNACVSQVSSIP